MSLGYLEKKIFPDVPDLPDLARSGQIWPDLGRLGKFFFQKKKKIFPDLARSGRPRSGDLAASVYKVSVEKIAVEFFSGFSLFHAQAGREIKLFYFHSVFCTVKTWA